MLDTSRQTLPIGQSAAPRPDGLGYMVVGCIGQRRAGSTGALRWALYGNDADGRPTVLSNTFAADLSRDGVAVLLGENGLCLRADGTVVCHLVASASPQRIAA